MDKKSPITLEIKELPRSGEQSAKPERRLSKSTRRGRTTARYVAILSLIVVCILAGIGGGYIYDKYGATSLSGFSSGYDGNKNISADESDIANVAEKVSPSVVSVLTTSTLQSAYSGASEQAGAGTGIIISADGYIMTNKHVVKGSRTVSVVAADGTTYDNVKVVGSDPLNDVAFLKISNVSKLKPAELGDSKTVRIGQKVVAIGNALGQYQNSVTSGIISGTGRSVQASIDGTTGSQSESLSDLFQTDAAINAGNSGGPLVNMAGQVIGINTAIASNANSVGFVIPIGATKGIMQSVINSGTVARAYIGVRYVFITPDSAKTYNLPVKQGAYVYTDKGDSVVNGSPAAQAGLQNKDVITKVNDIPIGSKGSLSTLVGEYKPGDKVTLTIMRDGKTIIKSVTLSAYKA